MTLEALRQDREFKVLAIDLRNIKSKGHKDAEIIVGDYGWPVITFTNKGTRYYYHRGADLFVLDLADACEPGKSPDDPPHVRTTPPVYRTPVAMQVPPSKLHSPLTPPANTTLRKYGITAEDYMRMLVEQDYKCAICRRPPPKIRRLNIDHCHKHGHVRGLLCYSCNYGLGIFRDAITSFENAAIYLRRNRR